MIWRGQCNFRQKAAHHYNAKAIIVINSNPHELFVMSGEKKPIGSNGCSDDDLPVSVLGKYLGDQEEDSPQLIA
jgi:hypothetical protein